MSEFVSYNANPVNRRAGDCTVRAISTLLEEDWEKTYVGLCVEGYLLCDMPSADHVWGSYLRKRGYERDLVRSDCPECFTVSDFCKAHPTGHYLLAIAGHVVAVMDGRFYDTWDSGNEVPVYFWYRKE